MVKCQLISPWFVDQNQLLDTLGLPELFRSLQVLSDNLVDGVQKGDHRVLGEVLGGALLPSWQVPDQVGDGMFTCGARREACTPGEAEEPNAHHADRVKRRARRENQLQAPAGRSLQGAKGRDSHSRSVLPVCLLILSFSHADNLDTLCQICYRVQSDILMKMVYWLLPFNRTVIVNFTKTKTGLCFINSGEIT